MLVWGYIFPKQHKIAISVPFGNISQYLVVCTVLLNYVKIYLIGETLTYFPGIRIAGFPLGISTPYSYYKECYYKQPLNTKPFVYHQES